MQMVAKLAEQQHAWDEIAVRGPKLTLKEKGRKKTPTGTVITYTLTAPELPKDKHYALMRWPLAGSIELVRMGVTLDGEGRLVCAGKAEGECTVKEGESPVIEVSMSFARGETRRLALISEDKESKALASVMEFPIEGKDKGCTLEARLVTNDARVLMVHGMGFASNADLAMTSVSAGKPGGASWRANDKGEVNAIVETAVAGQESGDFSMHVKGPACDPEIALKWGRGSYHAE